MSTKICWSKREAMKFIQRTSYKTFSDETITRVLFQPHYPPSSDTTELSMWGSLTHCWLLITMFYRKNESLSKVLVVEVIHSGVRLYHVSK